MSNMSYCRFENTANDLADCLEALFDDDLSGSEQRARQWLIKMCHVIAGDTQDEHEEMLEAARQRVIARRAQA